MTTFWVLQPYPHPSRRNCWEAIKTLPDGMEVYFKEPMRTLEQNALMWVIIQEIADIKKWPVNGRVETQDKDFWKVMLISWFRKELPLITQDLDGRMAVVSLSSKDIGKKEWTSWIEFLYFVKAKFEAEAQENAA